MSHLLKSINDCNRTLQLAALFTSAGLLALPGLAYAGILLDRIIVEMPHDQPPRQDLYVINEGSENAYVKVDVLAVNHPGESDEERVSLAGAEDPPFIASPARLVIGANGRKQIRLVNLQGAMETEQVFRVNVTPVAAPLQGEQGASVKVVIGYQALVIAHPTKPQEKLEVTRTDHALRLVNAGNTYVLLSDGKQCDTQGERCVDLPSRRLYAGNEWDIALPYSTPAAFTVTSYKGARQDRF